MKRAGSRHSRALDVHLEVEKAGKLRRQRGRRRGREEKGRGDEACRTTKRPSDVHDHEAEEKNKKVVPSITLSGARWLRRGRNPGSSACEKKIVLGGEVRRTAARPKGRLSGARWLRLFLDQNPGSSGG